jgi:hypothetical protein
MKTTRTKRASKEERKEHDENKSKIHIVLPRNLLLLLLIYLRPPLALFPSLFPSTSSSLPRVSYPIFVSFFSSYSFSSSPLPLSFPFIFYLIPLPFSPSIPSSTAKYIYFFISTLNFWLCFESLEQQESRCIGAGFFTPDCTKVSSHAAPITVNKQKNDTESLILGKKYSGRV